MFFDSGLKQLTLADAFSTTERGSKEDETSRVGEEVWPSCAVEASMDDGLEDVLA